jgi:hypothetical protein
MAPASLHNNLEAARGTRERWTTARPSSLLVMTPTRPRAEPSPYRHSNHRMPKAKTAPVKDRMPPLLVSSIPQQPTTPS